MDTLSDLAQHLGLSPNLVRKMSHNPGAFYHQTQIPKRSGGVRTISCPSRSLRATQRWILHMLLRGIPVDPHATAYRKYASPRDNAERHKDNAFFLFLDLKDFFPSIGAARVFSVFKALGYNLHICHILTALCTLDGALPQGAPTSPALCNIVCRKLDLRLSRLAGARNVTYTRYADDLTFSSKEPAPVQRCKALVERIITEEGFSINPKKTRMIGNRRQPVITGYSLCKGEVKIPRRLLMRARSVAFKMAFENDPSKKKTLRYRLIGLKGHFKGVNPATAKKVDKLEAKFVARYVRRTAAAGKMGSVRKP